MVVETPSDAISPAEAEARMSPIRGIILQTLSTGNDDRATLGQMRDHAYRVKRLHTPHKHTADYFVGTLEYWGLLDGPSVAGDPGQDAIYELTELGERLADMSQQDAEREYVSPTGGWWTPHRDLPLGLRVLGQEIATLRIANETDTEIHL